jgi:hypothetical protein
MLDKLIEKFPPEAKRLSLVNVKPPALKEEPSHLKKPELGLPTLKTPLFSLER